MTTTLYLLPTREPPPKQQVKPPPWRPPDKPKVQTTQTKINIHIKTTSELQNIMKKDRKKQEDRLLKHLSLRERQRQVQLRQMISQDPLFLVV